MIFREGNKAAGQTQGVPKLLAVGGRDLLMVDSRNVIWRWRPANTTGKGTITRVRVSGASEWGADVLAVGTFIRDREANLYNFYVVDVSAEQILRYSPAADGGGSPQRTQVARGGRDVSGIPRSYRRRHLARRRRPGPAGRERQRRRLGGRGAGRRRPSRRAGIHAARVRRGAPRRHDLRLRRRERPPRRPLEGQRLLPRPVPARRRRRMGGLPELLHRARDRIRAGRRGLGDQDRAPPRGPRGRAGARCISRARRLGRTLARRRGVIPPGQEPDPPDTGRHVRAHRRLLRGVRDRAFDHRHGRRPRARALLPAVGGGPGGHHRRLRDEEFRRPGGRRDVFEHVPARGLAAPARDAVPLSSATTSRTGWARFRSCCSTSPGVSRRRWPRSPSTPNRTSRSSGRRARSPRRWAPTSCCSPAPGSCRSCSWGSSTSCSRCPRSSSSGSGSASSCSMASRRSAPRRPRAAWLLRAHRRVVFGLAIGLLRRIVGVGARWRGQSAGSMG